MIQKAVPNSYVKIYATNNPPRVLMLEEGRMPGDSSDAFISTNMSNGKKGCEKTCFSCCKSRDMVGLRKTMHCLTVMVILALIAILVLVVTMAIMFTSFKNELKNHKHAPNIQTKVNTLLSQQDLCFECSDLQTGPSYEEEQIMTEFRQKKGVDGQKMCCVDTAKQLLKQLELFVENKFWTEVAKGGVKLPGYSEKHMTSERPAALLIAPTARLDRRLAQGKLFPISEWVTKHDVAFMKDVNYRYGRLIVPSDGYYYVYSQISYREYFDSTQGTQSQSLSHYIFRINVRYSKEDKLLQNSQTKCWSQRKSYGEYSSYIGSVLWLRKGDEVFVKVSNLTIISPDRKASYFGLYKL